MKVRLFAAVNLPPDLKKEITRQIEEIKRALTFPARFLKPDNWHLTISFLGYQDEQFLTPIMDSLKEAAASNKPPKIEFENITYGPLKGGRQTSISRMIWLNGSPETSNKLSLIKAELENNLIEQRISFRQESRPYRTHLTLARFEPRVRENLPLIKKEFNYEFYPKTLDLMQSHLKRGGAEYEILSNFDFKSIDCAR